MSPRNQSGIAPAVRPGRVSAGLTARLHDVHIFDKLEHRLPQTEVLYYQERNGTIPLAQWFDELAEEAMLKCLERLERLEKMGHELRRPEADYLRDDIYELRVRHLGVNFRMLYFFHERALVVVSHGFSKQRARVPPGEIDLAVRRRLQFRSNPTVHSFNPRS